VNSLAIKHGIKLIEVVRSCAGHVRRTGLDINNTLWSRFKAVCESRDFATDIGMLNASPKGRLGLAHFLGFIDFKSGRPL